MGARPVFKQEVQKMALGDTVVVGENEKRLSLLWDTGAVDENGDPVTRRQTIRVEATASDQDCYDIAYTLASLTTYTLVDISVSESTPLGPIT